jgi:hypothetical protein
MLFVATSGSCKVRVAYGSYSKEFSLSTRNEGLFADVMTWKEMYDFSDDCVLLVLSDSGYDSLEYIHDFDKYLKEVDRR